MPKEFSELPVQTSEKPEEAQQKLRDEVLRVPEKPISAEKMDALIADKQKELTDKYKVQFSKDNEDADKQWVIKADGTLDRGDMIKSRKPTLNELRGIEAALEKAHPSELSKDGKTAVKFYFLQDTYIKGDTGETIATYRNKDLHGNPAVFVLPHATDGRPITEADRPAEGEYSIESLLVHELAHNTEYSLNWDEEKTLIAISEKLGWAPYEDAKTHETIWLIKAKDNQFFKYVPAEDQWIRCNSSGGMVDKNGMPVDDQKKAQLVSTTFVRDNAVVRPVTDYFDNVTEMFAEGMMFYRLGGKRREQLEKESPTLFAFVKEQDEAERKLHRK
jgi:hypothetical protein